jgi:vacuolar-type H+-ATPase subunit D/Vma8
MKLRYIFIFCGFLILAGCAKPPITERDNAREAVSRAESNDNALKYGYETLERARTALKNMNDAIENKRYDAAKNYAAEAIVLADKAITDGNAKAAKAKEDAAALLSALKPEIEETSRNVNGARYSLMALDYDALDEGIKNAYNVTDQAEVDLAMERYQEALEKGRSVRSSLSNINNLVANAVTRKKL